MDLLSIINTGTAVINDVRGFAQSVKQAQDLKKRLQKKSSSTQSTLENLKKLVDDLGRADNNGSSEPCTSPDSGSNGVQSLLKQNGIDGQLEILGKTVEDIQERLKTGGNSNETKLRKIGNRLKRISRREKEERKIHGFLEDLSDIETKASVLLQTISIRLQDFQRRDEDERERKRIRMETERLDREEEAQRKETERRRQETEKQELEMLARLRREEEGRREETERRRQEIEKQELEKLEKQRKELIEWLKPYDYNSKHQSSTQLRQEGTCGWLLENETFQDWRSDSGSNFLWLHGIPGSGKTILFSKVVDYLENLADTTVVYHYCDFMNVESINPSTILRNIFVQLLRRPNSNWLDEFKDLSTAKKEGKSPPNGVQDLASYIRRACKFHQRTIIAIDALDECPENLERRKLLQLLGLGQMNSLSLFVTSRDESNFHTAFRSLPSISLDSVKTSVESDIRMAVARELKEHPRFSNSPDEEREEITRVIVKRAEGMFQLARCLIDVINDCFSKSAMAVLETSLPKGLNETYERLLKNIDLKEQSRRPAGLAHRTLMWLVGANRPLHILELYEAIMIEPNTNQLNEEFRMIDPADILAACGSLIQSFTGSGNRYTVAELHSIENVLDQNACDTLFSNKDVYLSYRTTYVRLSHYTVKEFLQTAPQKDIQLSSYHLSPTESSHDIAVLILTYLTLDAFDHLGFLSHEHYPTRDRGLRSSDDDYIRVSNLVREHRTGMLFIYCWTNWEAHLSRSKESPSVYKVLLQFLGKRLDQLCCCVDTLRGETLRVDLDHKYLYALLLFAIDNALVWVIRRLLNDHPEMGRLNPCESSSPLIIGSRNGGTDVVQILIEAGADVNAIDKYGGTALHVAASRGRLEVSTVLIQAGSNPNAIDQYGRSALHDAASRGQLEVSTMLIQAGANPNAADEEGETALHHAASEGRLEVSTMLIQAPFDPNTVDRWGRTALHLAAYQGHLELSTMLIQAGANPDAVDHGGRTALHLAAFRGHLELSTILIQAGADPNAVDLWGRTALHNAASRGHLEVSTMLIQAGVDLNAVDSNRDTALHTAVSHAQFKVVRLLIQGGIDPVPKNKSGKSPLHIAFDLHSKLMMECLISNGAPLADLGLLYVEQVQWAQALPWYSQFKLREFDHSAPVDEEVDVIPPRSVLEVRWILHKMLRLPSGVVSLILDLSEYWAHFFVWRKDQIVISGYNGVSYLSVKLRSKGSGSLQKVVFTTKSYEETKYSNPDKEPVYNKYSSRFGVAVTSPTGKPSLKRRKIQPNVSNSPISRIHVNTWEYKDHADWMNEIHPGDLISVHVEEALLEKNVVDFVRMDIYCAW